MRLFNLLNFINRLIRPTPAIHLTQWEHQVLSFLHRAATTAPSKRPIELRVAGGWVRDKLLNRPTGDIDIAIRYASGSHFANIVKHYAENYDANLGPCFIGPREFIPHECAATCIEPNPGKSRHLETAAVILDGHSLDFVQLRTEDYADSRVPHSISPASPYEDAMRRDFTINAMFYNIHTFRIEDWTGKGLSDLKCGVLRTPLGASVTLKEDPLRCLRAIRFASKLSFSMEPTLRNALLSTDLHDTLIRKVSRERIGNEASQIINSRRPIQGLRIILDSGLVQAVFRDSFGKTYSEAEKQFSEVLISLQDSFSIWDEVSPFFSEQDRSSLEKECKEVLIFSLLARDTCHVRPILFGALRRPRSLERDVKLVITCGKRIISLIGNWGQLYTNNPSKVDDDTWIKIAETLRKAGERLFIPTLIYSAVCINQKDLCKTLFQMGFNLHIFHVPLIDGRTLAAGLNIVEGPVVGLAKKQLVQIQLLQLRWFWKLKVEDDPIALLENQNRVQWLEAVGRRLSK